MPWTIQKPIVVPFDFSAHSIEAVRRAVEMAESPQQVHALHVLPFLIPTEPGVVWGTVDDESRIQHALQHMAEALPKDKYGSIVLDVRLGDPGQVVSDRAEELNAELVIVGSHGRTGLTRVILGSVAERVTRLAHCPVLVIKLAAVPEEAAGHGKKSVPLKSAKTAPV